MESFEQFVAVALEAEQLVVSEAVKFPVARQTRKATAEIQEHGYEVDLLGARSDRLVLASVKSYFGSYGVHFGHLTGTSGTRDQKSRYLLFNDKVIQKAVIGAAAKRFGYPLSQVSLRLYAGKFYGKRPPHEPKIRQWAAKQRVGGGPIEVFGVGDVLDTVRAAARSKSYRNNPVLGHDEGPRGRRAPRSGRTRRLRLNSRHEALSAYVWVSRSTLRDDRRRTCALSAGGRRRIPGVGDRVG